jgi:predicted homoserine dehydrogenase-like protein
MIHKELAQLEEQNQPIRVGVSGAGWIGSGFVQQCNAVKGMTVNLLADENLDLARETFVKSGVDPEMIIEAGTPGAAMDALRAGNKVITGSYQLASQVDDVDIVADITPSPTIGAETAFSCIQNGKDVVMVNIEADVTVGSILKKKAEQAGILYTVSSGDEPGCLMELYDFVKTLGFEPIVIGKGKNNPLNPVANPDMVADSARKTNKDPYQVASYVDGTKTMFEMTCAANAVGAKPIQRGMVGPEADLNTVSQIFALQEDGGLTITPNSVDFVQGPAMSGGVFIVTRVKDERIQDDLEYLKVGKGKYFTFFRPYHLWFIEAPISVAKAYLHREITLVSQDQPTADVMTIAKKDLKPGELLDEFGGYTFHGVMDHYADVRAANALPVGLAPGAKMVSMKKKGELITWDDVQLDESQIVVKLRREQDQLLTTTSGG